jgi:tyrosinase
MTAQEKADFVLAVKLLKTVPSPFDSSLNYYDQFVKWHFLAFYCDGTSGGMGGGMFPAHMNPGFLPWHRSYLDLFEKALSAVSGKQISLPYWDWTDAASTAAVFSNDMMGGFGDSAQGYRVTTGPFRQGEWTIRITDDLPILDVMNGQYNGTSVIPDLIRARGIYKLDTISLPTTSEVNTCLNVGVYDCAPWDASADTNSSFRNSLEGWRGCAGNQCLSNNQMDIIPIPNLKRSVMHNAVHIYVGGVFPANNTFVAGTMAQNTSPNDPIFFLHHANIDRLWSAWMNRHGRSYVPVSGGPMGANLYDVMDPFSFRTDGFNTPHSVIYESVMGYRYDQLP